MHLVVPAAILAASSAYGQGIFQPSYNQTTSFDGSPAQLLQHPMGITFDGSHYWTAAGGSSNGNRLADFDSGGNYVASYQPGIDFRAVFTVGGNGSQVYGRGFASSDILRQTSPGVFTTHLTLSGGIPDSQSNVVFDSTGSEYIAHSNGTISRWSLSGSSMGTVALSGYGSMFSEGSYPNNRGVICAGGYYLTYSNGNLSAWDAAGTRVGNTVLNGAGTNFDSHFSFGWGNNMVWVADGLNTTWRGYLIPELLGGYLLSISGQCPGTITVNWNGATPSVQQGIVFGQNQGTTIIPGGPCAGTQLGVQNGVQLVRTIGTGSGSGSVNGTAGTAACRRFLQLVEAGSCNTSNVAQIP
jgi:hypothetical protein